jgi:hypothetical protein
MIKTKGLLAGLNKTVTPVKSWVRKTLKTWIPAFAGMTLRTFARGSKYSK